MSATVHQIAAGSVLLTKQQLAKHFGRSTRWVELRMRDGLPSVPPTQRFPHRRFDLAAVEDWLADGTLRPKDRLSLLEDRVATLAATVERLERRTG